MTPTRQLSEAVGLDDVRVIPQSAYVPRFASGTRHGPGDTPYSSGEMVRDAGFVLSQDRLLWTPGVLVKVGQ